MKAVLALITSFAQPIPSLISVALMISASRLHQGQDALAQSLTEGLVTRACNRFESKSVPGLRSYKIRYEFLTAPELLCYEDRVYQKQNSHLCF